MNHLSLMFANYPSAQQPAPSNDFSFFWAILLVIVVVPLLLAPYFIVAKMARDRVASVPAWLVATFFLGWIAVLILYFFEPAYRPKMRKGSYYPTFTPKKEPLYSPFKCAKCEETIQTRRCGYCGFENDVQNKVALDEAEQEQWLCKCGARNAHKLTECSVCFAPRPR